MNKHPTKIGETVCINKPSSPLHNRFCEYVGLADVVDGLEQQYRVDVGNGEIQVFYINELIII